MNRRHWRGFAFRIRTLGLATAVLLAGAAPGCSGGSTTPTSASVATGPTGLYDLTLTASASCAMVLDSATGQSVPFPDAVKVRQYAAEFANGSATLTSNDPAPHTVHLGGIDTYDRPGRPLMTLDGTTLTITVPGNIDPRTAECATSDYWWEDLTDGSGVAHGFELCGTWRAYAGNPARISGTINGKFIYSTTTEGAIKGNVLFCSATDHQFTMTLR